MPRAKPSRARRSSPTPGLLTATEYARRRGVSKQAVAKAIASGRIPTVRAGRRKLVDPAIADPAWAENTDPSSPKGARANGSVPPAAGTQAAEALELARIRRRKLEREEREAERQLVNARDAEAHFQKLTREARDKFLALADTLGLELAPITDPRQTTLLMRREFTRILNEMVGDEEQDDRARASG